MVEYVHEAKPVIIEQNARTSGKVALVGVIVGLLAWGLTWLLEHYLFKDALCDSAAVCLEATTYAGNIAGVIMAIAAVVALVRLSVFRPLLIVLGAIISLWGMAAWLSSIESMPLQIGISVLLYALLYSLYAWIARLRHPAVMLIVFAIVVTLTRVVPLVV